MTKDEIREKIEEENRVSKAFEKLGISMGYANPAAKHACQDIAAYHKRRVFRYRDLLRGLDTPSG